MPYAVTMEMVTSSRWSSTVAISRDASQPAAHPMTRLTTIVPTNASSASPMEIPLVTTWTAMANATRPVPSLSRLSPSTSVSRRGGVGSRWKVETTAAGSVAATIAPTTKPSWIGSPVPIHEERSNDRGRDQHARRREQRDAAERVAQLVELDPVGGLEHEPGQKEDQQQLRRDDRIEVRQHCADHEATDDERDRVRDRRVSPAAQRDADQRRETQQGDEELDGPNRRVRFHLRMVGTKKRADPALPTRPLALCECQALPDP